MMARDPGAAQRPRLSAALRPQSPNAVTGKDMDMAMHSRTTRPQAATLLACAPSRPASAARRRQRRQAAAGVADAAPVAGLSLRPSRIHGTGVFTIQAIARRQKLGILTGTVLRLPAARRDHQRRAVIQLVELSRRWALDCTRGNAFRHLNHHCQPNCYLRIIRRTVEVYSRAAIADGSELTVNYGETQHHGGMACRCGAPRCRSSI